MRLNMDGWAGGPLAGEVDAGRLKGWVIARRFPEAVQHLAPTPPEAWDWRDPKVGFGVVLPNVPGAAPADLAAARDAPEPIRALLAARPGAKVLRYLGDDPTKRFTHLRDSATDRDIDVNGAAYGIGPTEIPRFLLIYGSPRAIPWRFQARLNGAHCVGRLDLEGEALEHYVTALLDDFDGLGARGERAVFWATDHGRDDITHLMRTLLADPLATRLTGDSEIGASGVTALDMGAATGEALVEALADRNPGLVVTTSHGCLEPMDDAGQLGARLGEPIDQHGHRLSAADLLAGWDPDGAIWYAHACCSAGGNASSAYDGLFEASSPIARALAGAAAVGDVVAPLPRALLGAKRPLRAFIGQVEPTFNWTLLQPRTEQALTEALVRGLYDELYRQRPVAWAMAPWYQPIAGYLLAHRDAVKALLVDEEAAETVLYLQLAALDRASTVVLGDPTVTLPPLPSQVRAGP